MNDMELKRLEEACSAIGVTVSPYYRPPEGCFNEAMLREAQSAGYKTVFWSFAYADWDNGRQPDPVAAKSKILVSMGHTDAKFEEAMSAARDGVNHATHLFNAMSALAHRNPGVVGAALASENVSVEVIADTFHINPGLYSIIAKVKGDKMVLITDCTRAGGLEDGEYTLGGQPIYVKGIECRLSDGTIAGSVLKMNDAVRNFRDHAQVPFHEAVNCASLYAARSIGADGCKGSLEAGKDADIVLLDGDCGVHGVLVGGVRKA